MIDDSRVDELLEELLMSGGSPEEACRSCPELLPQVRSGWQRLRRLEAEVSSLFPPPEPPEVAMPPALPASELTTGVAREAHPSSLSEYPSYTGKLPTIRGYEVQQVLGYGGMGIVYKAWHRRLNRTVALKMLLAGPHIRTQELERFLREAEAVAGLHHPNIVQVYDGGDYEGRPFFTMEYIEGGTLSRRLAETPLPPRDAAGLVATLTDAVRAAHAAGIVHRDLKPSNILLQPKEKSHGSNTDETQNPSLIRDPSVATASDLEFRISDFTPKVSDFGLARRIDGDARLTRTGAAMGTPSYMAPEQARGDTKAVGPATDVYALGAILYECLTGRPPFQADTATATIQQVLADDPVPPARLNPRVPRDLDTICLKCLEKDPGRRYPSAAALEDDLRRFTQGEPIAARPAGLPERAAKWVRRRPATAALMAAGVLMFAGVTAAGGWYASDRSQRGRQVNREANAALVQAEIHLNDLRDQLDHTPQVWELLSDIDRWGRLVDRAQQDLQQANSAAADNEALLTKETQARIEAVEAAVAHEQAAYELARDLDNVAVEARSSPDSNGSPQRKAMAEFERLFSRQGLDVHRPGTAWFASAVQSSPARFALIAALDNWAWLAAVYNVNERFNLLVRQGVRDITASISGLPDDPRLARILELARAADPDPWRDRFRHPDVWAGAAALKKLADEIEVGQQSPTVLTSFGWWLQASGGDQTALYERSLLEHPRNFWLHLNAALLTRGKHGARVGLFHAALAIRPQSALAYAMLASSLQEQGDWPESLVAANRAIAIKPNFSLAYHYQGLALLHKKDLHEAVAAFQRAIDLDPRTFSCRPRHGLGQVLQQQGRYAEAGQAYLGAIRADPTIVPAYDSLARLLATCPDDKTRDGKRAIEYATTACERTDWKDPLCLDTLAAAYAEAGQFDEAVRYQTRALEDPTLKGDARTAAKERLELYRQKKPFREEGPNLTPQPPSRSGKGEPD